MARLKYLRGYLSWIVFALFPNSAVTYAALAGLLVALLLFLQDRRRSVPWSAQVLDVSTMFFFLALSISAAAAPHAPLGTWSSMLSFGWLALTAWGSLAFGHPFTLGMALQSVTPEVAARPEFRRSHFGLTRLWAVAFTLIAAALALCDAAHQGAALTLAVRLIGLGVPAYLTARHVKGARARIAAAAPTA
jgi:hypothetical protein